jgi:hypothetical protein
MRVVFRAFRKLPGAHFVETAGRYSSVKNVWKRRYAGTTTSRMHPRFAPQARPFGLADRFRKARQRL